MVNAIFLGAHYWRTQLPIDYIDTSLVINTWETVAANLSGGEPAELWLVLLEQTNNGATAEDLELEITMNGTAYTFAEANAGSGVLHYCSITAGLTGGDFSTIVGTNLRLVGSEFDIQKPFTCDSVGLIRVRQTTNVDGTSAQIEVNIVWDKLI